jgi:hypothetical protein
MAGAYLLGIPRPTGAPVVYGLVRAGYAQNMLRLETRQALAGFHQRGMPLIDSCAGDAKEIVVNSPRSDVGGLARSAWRLTM